MLPCATRSMGTGECRHTCGALVFLAIRLIGEDWLPWLIGVSGVSCLWLPTCVDEMRCGVVVTVQCSVLAQNTLLSK